MTSYLLTACSVCAGDPASPLSQGLIAGVTVLLGVVAFVLGGIAWTALTWSRRAKRQGEAVC